MKRKYIHFVVFIYLAFTHFFGETNTYKEEGKWKTFAHMSIKFKVKNRVMNEMICNFMWFWLMKTYKMLKL